MSELDQWPLTSRGPKLLVLPPDCISLPGVQQSFGRKISGLQGTYFQYWVRGQEMTKLCLLNKLTVPYTDIKDF